MAGDQDRPLRVGRLMVRTACGRILRHALEAFEHPHDLVAKVEAAGAVDPAHWREPEDPAEAEQAWELAWTLRTISAQI